MPWSTTKINQSDYKFGITDRYSSYFFSNPNFMERYLYLQCRYPGIDTSVGAVHFFLNWETNHTTSATKKGILK
jgi:hypothetical protein